MLKPKIIKPISIKRALIRLIIVSAIFIYCLFAIIFVCFPAFHNLAECDRLERNYVTCKQHHTSIDLTIWAFANLFSIPVDKSSSQFSYQLKGAEIYNDVLYLETDRDPILYKHRRNSRGSYAYSIRKVESFIRGKESGKLTLYLENSFIVSAAYLSACLVLGAIIIGIAYYSDKNLVPKTSRSN